ncbi:MAG: exopolysaccharide biosynthesis polyprenyl glycosylphosphotransferase [Bacteroidales bacterium]|nr:exopolysaccharide biosynthesis polyprenyl glycosylphosphotransferase [Bacteroidales bacterium]
MKRIKSLSRSLKIDLLKNNVRKREKLMIIADEDHLAMLYEMTTAKKWDFQVAYILTDSTTVREFFPKHSRVYPLKANIKSLLRHDVIDEIVCCTSTLSNEYLTMLAETSQQFGVSLIVSPEIMKCARIPVSGVRVLADYYFLALETNPGKRFEYAFKSFVEKTFAATAIFILFPFLLTVALLIKINSDGPVFFMQKRVGLRGRKFYLYKFRTMVADAEKLKASLSNLNEADGPAFKMANDPRITRVGRILRKTGIDEIPQLYNVLRGEMALIGPRPLLPDEVLAQEEWHLKRMCIKPGITCTWQIQRERNKVPFDQWMQLDREYVENWSLQSDMSIFFKTFGSMFAARGV